MKNTLSKDSKTIFFLVAVGVFLSTMDSSMTNVALPGIMRSFGSSFAQTEWVVLTYLLTISVSLLFWGHFADQYGKSTVYLVGMGVFTAGSFACYLAPSLLLLCIFRFLQATGAAMMMATGPAIIKMVFPVEKLGMALGFIGIATSTGLLLGPVVSGILIYHYSWRCIFLVTVPVSFLVFFWGWFCLRPDSVEKEEDGYFADWMGMILWALLISAVVLFSTLHIEARGIVLVGEGCVLVLLGSLFLKIEFRQKTPMFPLTLFRNRSYSIAMFCAMLSFTVLFVVLILMPFYMDYILGMSTQQIGLVMMSIPLSVFLISPLSGMLYDRIGARLLTTSGLGLASISLFFICFLSENSASLDVVWRLALLGCGQALFLSPNSAEVLASVKQEELGISSGLLATARNIGMLFGVSLAGLLFTVLFSRFTGGYDLKHFQAEQTGSFMAALSVTFAVTAILSIIGAVLSGLRQTQIKRIRTAEG